MSTGKPVDGYIRVSRVQGREGDSYISPTVQREAIQRWSDYKDVPIGEWHVDEDWSGGTHTRPGLERAVQRALSGESGGIVSWKIDRFSRQTEGGLRDLRRLQEVDARLAFVVEDIDTATVYGRMIYTILLAVSEAFLETVKAGWETAKERAVKRGAYISRTPFGYQRQDDGTLTPHPEHAPIVTEAFRLAASSGLRATADYLTESAPERKWPITSVRRLLAGQSYLGHTRWDDQLQPGTHDALVSRAVWEAAQVPLTRRLQRRSTLPLSGIAQCGNCDAPMISGGTGDHQRAYRCSATASRGGTCTMGASISAVPFDEYVREETRRLLTGLRATISEPGTSKLSLLERVVLDAEAEMDAFAADLTMRRSLGDRYHTHLQSRVDAVEKARGEYREEARLAQAHLSVTGPEMVDDPELFPVLLRSLFSAIVVNPGRGLAVKDRVELVPLEADDASGVAIS